MMLCIPCWPLFDFELPAMVNQPLCHIAYMYNDDRLQIAPDLAVISVGMVKHVISSTKLPHGETIFFVSFFSNYYVNNRCQTERGSVKWKADIGDLAFENPGHFTPLVKCQTLLLREMMPLSVLLFYSFIVSYIPILCQLSKYLGIWRVAGNSLLVVVIQSNILFDFGSESGKWVCC